MLPPYRGILSALLFWSCYFSLCLSCLIRADLFRSGSNHSSSFRFGSFGAALFCSISLAFRFNSPISSCFAVSLVLFSLQSQSLSLSVSLPLWPSLYDFLSSVQASRSLLLCISVQSMPQGHQVRFFPFSPSFAVPSVLLPLLFLPHGLFSSILPVSLCLSALLPVLFPVPSRSHARSGLASVQHCR